MAEIRVTSRDGAQSTLDAGEGRLLMEALRDANFGVDGTCGGMCSCGTCHVYIDPAWSQRLPPRTEDEQMMLDAIGELVEVRTTSRLSCQIRVSAELTGLKLEVGPVA